ncbi:MAG: hypothetical protein PHU85_04115 [Phycisphaerae bacterium]|nr:hypothetical protein [Phycisphaerae bacterium]
MVRKNDIRLIDTVVRIAGLSREQRRLLHREISGQDLSYRQILEQARDIKKQYPRK